MKAAIMLSNCAAGSSLFSDAPRPHRAPLCLIYCLWEAQRDAAPTSTPNWCALFICLYLFKWVSWFQSCSRLTPAAPRQEGDDTLGSVLNWCTLFIGHFFHEGSEHGCIAGVFTLALRTFVLSPWKNGVHSSTSQKYHSHSLIYP